MGDVDVLIVTALQKEFEAAQAAGLSSVNEAGVASWELHNRSSLPPFILGEYVRANGTRFSVALARPTRKGSLSTSTLATALSERLKPSCLAMTGVCAGNPAIVMLGDVVVAEMAYTYDEGKRTTAGLSSDPRPIPLDDRWVRAAQELPVHKLASFREATDDEARIWLLEQLLADREPRDHPARLRYFPEGTWNTRPALIEADGLIIRQDRGWTLTDAGKTLIEHATYDNVDGPDRLPFAVVVGPMASGNVVVKDGVTWDQLRRMGVETVTGLDMEAAAIATVAHQRQIPHWLVAKGVTDYADPSKDDRYKSFAARASAEVLYALLDRLIETAGIGERHETEPVIAADERPQSTPTVQPPAVTPATAGGVTVPMGSATKVARDDPGAEYRADAAARYALAVLERDPELAILVAQAAVTELAPTPLAVHTRYLTLARGIGTVRPRLADRGVQVLPAQSGPIVRLTWLADGQLVTGSSANPHFHVWARSGTLVAAQSRSKLREGRELLHAGFAMDCTPAGNIAISTQDLIRLWSPTGAPVASWSATPLAQKIASFNLARKIARFNVVIDLAWSPDGRWLAGGCIDHTVRIWNPATKAVVHTLTGHQDPVRIVKWAPNGTVLAGATRERTIRVWQVMDERGHELVGHSGRVNAIAWAPDGILASASDDGTVRLWDPDGSLARTLTGHRHPVRAVAWSPDGGLVASGSADRTVRIWTADGECRHELTGGAGSVNVLAWSRDGRLASGWADGTVRVFAPDSGLSHELPGHTAEILGVAWASDGRLASADRDGTARVWPPMQPTEGYQALMTQCRLRELTPEERQSAMLPPRQTPKAR